MPDGQSATSQTSFPTTHRGGGGQKPTLQSLEGHALAPKHVIETLCHLTAQERLLNLVNTLLDQLPHNDVSPLQ